MNYDHTNQLEIEIHGKKLEHNSISELYSKNEIYEKVGEIKEKDKGKLGKIIEVLHFGYELNSRKEADFYDAGIELKVVPLKKINKKEKSDLLREQKGLSVKERMVLSIIDYISIVNEEWNNNSLFSKTKKLLLPFYIYEKDVSVYNLIFELVSLWTPDDTDIKIIQKDWELIVDKIKKGKAHELSEGDTMYLGACTKGATAESTRKQPFSDIVAKQRAFSFKRSYVDVIFEELLQKKKTKQLLSLSSDIDFQQTLNRIFKPYFGKTAYDIENEFGLNFNDKIPKQYYSILSNKIMGVESEENIEEIKKANITLKTLRITKKGIPKEDISFPTFSFEKIVLENWETSELYSQLEEQKFLLVIFLIEYDNISDFDKLSTSEKRKYVKLEKVKLWNMPMTDLESDVKNVWVKTKQTIQDGISVWQNGERLFNNFPNASETQIAHVRPHGKNAKDTLPLPNNSLINVHNKELLDKYPFLKNNEFTKQSFWLNKKYIAKIIK